MKKNVLIKYFVVKDDKLFLQLFMGWIFAKLTDNYNWWPISSASDVMLTHTFLETLHQKFKYLIWFVEFCKIIAGSAWKQHKVAWSKN